MPEHIHLLLSEPEVSTPSTVMQVLKQRTARALLPKVKRRDPRQSKLLEELQERSPFWQARFYDFNVRTEKKRVEKLRYMHRNPVARRLVAEPEDWQWSSYRFYFLDEAGPVRVNEGWGRIEFQAPATWRVESYGAIRVVPTLRKKPRRMGHPLRDSADGRLGHPARNMTEAMTKSRRNKITEE